MRVRAEYDSAIKCREEIIKVEQEMKKLNENSSPKEIERLTRRYAELTAKWENSMSFIGRTGAYMQEAFYKAKDAIAGSNTNLQNMAKSSKTVLDAAKEQLEVQEKILESYKQQREAANSRISVISGKREYKDRLESSRKSVYGGASENTYSESDRKALSKAREDVDGTTDEWERLNEQVKVYDQLIEDAGKKIAKTKKDVDMFSGITSSSQTATESLQEMLQKFIDLSMQAQRSQTYVTSYHKAMVEVLKNYVPMSKIMEMLPRTLQI